MYAAGQAVGNNPRFFSRIGDCQSMPSVFLGIYDTDRYWFSDDYAFLQRTVDQFSGAFEAENVTAVDGFSVASVLSPLMANKDVCTGTETPLACEYRLHKPVFFFISLGTNWHPGEAASFEGYLRQIVDFSIANGVIPVLMTKADNIEGDGELNEAIARVAYDYEAPLVNTWLAVQYLPNHGLEEDGIYLTTTAWDERAFTALQTLDALWQALEDEPK